MKRVLTGLLKAAVLPALLVLVVFFAWAFESRSMPALQIWHTALLGSEFTAHRATPNSSLQDYLSREQQLFDELRDEIYKRVEPTDDVIYSRYRAGGVQDPAWPRGNWNRTFELVPSQIRGGALQPRGETHLLTAPLSQLMRLRHNPFFEYLKQRVSGAADSALRLNSR